MLSFATCYGIIAWIIAIATSGSALKIFGDLIERSKDKDSIDLFVQLKPLDFSQFDDIATVLQERDPYFGLQQFPANRTMVKSNVRTTRRQAVYEALLAHSKTTQRTIVKDLEGLGYTVKSFWIDNSLMIKDVPTFLVNTIISLAATPAGSDIVSLSPNRIIAHLPPPIASTIITKADGLAMLGKSLNLQEEEEMDDAESNSALWNLQLINAHKAWKKTKGKGIVVASIDTGVDFLHPALKASYRGSLSVKNDKDVTRESVSHDYNWFDPSGEHSSFPYDDHGHGTHTTGTMVGQGVGVAPDAKWIAAKGCGKEYCTQESLLESAQWVMCPTGIDGKSVKCELGADIVNNSWGGAVSDDESMTWFSGPVNAWLAAGMFPVFAQGNLGPACGSVSTPGDLETVIGVGAIDRIGALSFFSSRGPGLGHLGHARFKPDYVAPGQDIISCQNGGGLVSMSGTSMAAPHVAGAIALLLSLKPNLSFDKLCSVLTDTTDTNALCEPQMGQQTCFGVQWNKFPNYHYGHGLIDINAAVGRLTDE